MKALAQRPDFVPRTQACAALGVPRSRLYPDRRKRDRKACIRQPQSRQLSPVEREEALTLMHSERFCDQAPRQIYGNLLSEGTVVASVSTLYRLLRGAGEAQERRRQRPPQRHAVPRLEATAPNQVWTWDITKLPTLVTGVFLCLYVILDLYSRFVVGWMVSRKENAGLARHLFKHTLARHEIAPDTLIVHQDRGAPMTAHSFRELLLSMGVDPSYSRPRVSNDNAFSESHFKTIKYAPDYPGRFSDADHAREWFKAFIPSYHLRPHEGLALYTPADVRDGRIDAVWQVRQAALDRHYSEHPERYPKGPPVAKKPPAVVTINPLDGHPTTAADMLKRPSAFRSQTAPTETGPPEVFTQKS